MEKDIVPKKKKNYSNNSSKIDNKKNISKREVLNNKKVIVNEEVLPIKNNRKNISKKETLNNKKAIDNEEVLPIKKVNENVHKKNNNYAKSISKKSNDDVKYINQNNNKTSNADKIEKVKHDEKTIIIKKKKKKLKLKKKPLLILILFIIIIINGVFFGIKFLKKSSVSIDSNQDTQILDVINSHYNKYVKIINDSTIYNDELKEIGKIYKDEKVELEESDITNQTKYFKIKNLGLINYESVSPIDEIGEYDTRFKNYLPFNKNIVTNDKFTLYDNDKKVITLYNEMDFPIIINDYENRYYIEYQDRLLNIKKDDVKEVKDSKNTNKKNASKVTTFCYHRIYDETSKCNDTYICKKKSAFDKEMKYLKDNNYFTFKMEEMYLYLKGKLQVEKAVLVTLDDGYRWDNAIEIFEKYNLNGTGFIITGRFDDLTPYKSNNFELQSHTNAMHDAGYCKSGLQGGGILCISEDKVLNDLNTSKEKIGNAIALAYPFYDYNERAMKLVEKAGFKMAFIGANGVKGKSSPGVNMYKIPRMTIYDSTSFEKWKSYL